jgi:hypothetical protein
MPSACIHLLLYLSEISTMPSLALSLRLALLYSVSLGLSSSSVFLGFTHLFHSHCLLVHLLLSKVILISDALVYNLISALACFVDFFHRLSFFEL